MDPVCIGRHCSRCDRCIPVATRSEWEAYKKAERDRVRHPGRYAPRVCEPCAEAIEAERNSAAAVEARRAARQHELRTMPYNLYLQSPEWQERRKQHLQSAGYRCQVCNAGNVTLDVHHRTYERRGCESYMDLTVLCRTCHDTFHNERELVRHQ